MLIGAREMDNAFSTGTTREQYAGNYGAAGHLVQQLSLNCETTAVIPYCERLLLLPSYLQQLDMESNGKATNLERRASGL